MELWRICRNTERLRDAKAKLQVALLGPPQSPHQSLAVWSLEQLALAKVIPSLLTPDSLALGTQIPGSPATGSPAPESPAPGNVAS
ncbi:unnamed protein product [Boreogadus saida]